MNIPPWNITKWWLAGGTIVVMLVAIANSGDETTTAGGVVKPPVVTAAPTTTPAPVCYSDEPKYSGQDGCTAGGELVTVDTVENGNTFRLTDGRTVRLLGVDRVGSDDCVGEGATAYLRAMIERKMVRLYAEPGEGADDGRLLRYVKYNPDPVNVRDLYTADVGMEVVAAGWGVPIDGPNDQYATNLKAAATSAPKHRESDCEQPAPLDSTAGDDSDTDVDLDIDVDVDVDAPHVDAPDLDRPYRPRICGRWNPIC